MEEKKERTREGNLVVVSEHVGEFRAVNIYKEEPVIGGNTVKYSNYDALVDTLEYDIERENRSYAGLTIDQMLKRIAGIHFCNMAGASIYGGKVSSLNKSYENFS